MWMPRFSDGVKKRGATVLSAANKPQLDSQLEFILEKKILLEEEESPKKKCNPKEFIMFRAIKRIFIWLGLMAEKATENDAINQAVVERGIRDSKAKADKAHYANGQLASQIALLKDQIKRQQRQREDLQGMLQAAAAANDEANGAHYGGAARHDGSGSERQQEPGAEPRRIVPAEHPDHCPKPARDSKVPARI